MKMPATRFEDLVVWQRSQQFVLCGKLLEAYWQAILNSDS